MSEKLDRLKTELAHHVVGQERVIERLIVSMLANGHCLLEGVPGVGKTMMTSTLAKMVGGTFSRIQFTPDLLPSDIVGTRIYRASKESFDIELGPVFANFVLADEINRAPAKVQSALLEVMAERQVTIGGVTNKLQKPFMVLATQNPIEQEGVYLLPEAQRDRFLMRVPVDYPTMAEESEIARRTSGGSIAPRQILDIDELVRMQEEAAALPVPDAVADYAVRLVMATRAPRDFGFDALEGWLSFGASPRATLGLLSAGRALAYMRGHGAVRVQDIYDIAYDVLNHRLVLSWEAVTRGATVDEFVVALLERVLAPMGW
jgi:MoxR-like ATPase